MHSKELLIFLKELIFGPKSFISNENIFGKNVSSSYFVLNHQIYVKSQVYF